MSIKDQLTEQRLAVFKELDMTFLCAAFDEGKRSGLLHDGYYTPDDLAFTLMYCHYGIIK